MAPEVFRIPPEPLSLPQEAWLLAFHPVQGTWAVAGCAACVKADAFVTHKAALRMRCGVVCGVMRSVSAYFCCFAA